MRDPLHKERVKKLCESIASEQDPDRFMELVNALNNLLQQSEKRPTPVQLFPESATEM
jgi:hypothetical protein